ncbi:hypothetical protein MesoLj131b_73100 (plasmid) [Mesorhizobium sp. 131-2-5]|nr:hypothetical protein MesoLj131b_73100 [Mesorhizobium sp. 131-2-5]
MTSYNFSDFDKPYVTISLRFGKPEDWPDLVATKLFNGEWFPVCSPGFLESHPTLLSGDPSAFLEVPLLHFSTPEAIDSWESWLGVDGKLDGQRFSNYLSMIHETIAGRGIALAWIGFIEEHLRLGHVVRLTPMSRRHDNSFYIVTGKTISPVAREVVKALVDSIDDYAGQP